MNIIYPKIEKNLTKKEQTGNPKKYPQGYFKNKACKWCNKEFTPIAPSEHYCSDICKDKGRLDSTLLNKYGITLKQYEQMWIDQNGLCKICNKNGLHRTKYNNSTPLVIDHDHKTHKVRGLLCHTCNTALGQFNDDITLLKNAIKYLKSEPKVNSDPSIRNRITRNRKTSNISVNEGKSIIDLYLTGVSKATISKKLSISEGVIKGIVNKTTQFGRYLWKTYYNNKSATTIPKGSTLQANGNGSGLPLTGSAEGDDIV